MNKEIEIRHPKSFHQEAHWYPKALHATIHPMLNFFLNLDKDKIISRFCHLHPKVNQGKLEEVLSYQSQYFLWSGADLINSTSAQGKRHMVVIENNSCPSGQKSMPLVDDHKEDGTYRLLIERSFIPFINGKKGSPKIKGALAVIYDKNYVETSGYASVIADVMNEPVYLVPFYHNQGNELVRVEDGLFSIFVKGEWIPLRGVFKYLTQRPWNRIPLHTKTRVFNPIVACLAGGRNKMVAAKAYNLFNAELAPYGLKINIPETIWDVRKEEVPLWVHKLGDHAVIKIPYSNAGQGVFTITSKRELDAFMKMDFEYERFIVQSLIGNYHWSSTSPSGKFYHVGTIPNNKGEIFVADIRMMVSTTPEGIRPICAYARRAARPLPDELTDGRDSWEILGTNLSIKLGENEWSTDTSRLITMDRREFNKLGLGLDDLIEAYIQTVLSTIAIDKLSGTLFNTKGKFRMKLFESLNDDESLLKEITV